MVKAVKVDWDYLDGLGKKYYELVQKGYGLSAENRCREQIEIINTIIVESSPYLKLLVRYFFFGNGIYVYPNGQLKSISFRYMQKKNNIEDLINEGCLGLIKYFKNYDPNKGSVSKFIKNHFGWYIYKYAVSNNGLIKIPPHVYEKFKSILRSSLDKEEIAKNITEKENLEKRRRGVRYNPIPAGSVITGIHGCHENIEDMEDIFDESSDAVDSIDEELIEIRLRRESIDRLLSILPERQRKIVSKRFGYMGRKYTLEEVAKEESVSRERIRQIENRAIRKLRKSDETSALKKFYFDNI